MKNEDHGHVRSANPEKRKPADYFLQRMLYGTSGASLELARKAPVPVALEPYSPLRQVRTRSGASYFLPQPSLVQPESPAIEVMTDLKRVAAVTTRRLASVDEANRTMITHSVRALFVVDDERGVAGIITSTDVLGEKPIQITQQRGIRHDEVLVRDVMTPTEHLEVMDFADVLNARVGDVLAALRLSGRQHALVVEQAIDAAATGPRNTVRGIFSLTQIAKQLGLAARPGHDIGRTFAEIEAAISS
jgi:CBS domain-containing protein